MTSGASDLADIPGIEFSAELSQLAHVGAGEGDDEVAVTSFESDGRDVEGGGGRRVSHRNESEMSR
jgi:hypothetical protein